MASRMRINPLLDDLGEYSIGRMQEMARRMRSEGRRMFDFSIGDPREPTAPFIIQADEGCGASGVPVPDHIGSAGTAGRDRRIRGRRFGVESIPPPR